MMGWSPDATYQVSWKLVHWFRKKIPRGFTIYGHDVHHGHVTKMQCTNFYSPYPNRFYIKFGQVVSEEMFENVNGRSKDEALPGRLGNRGKFRGTGERMHNFEGNRRAKTIFVNGEHKKTNFRFFGNRGTSQFVSGEQIPPGRASRMAYAGPWVYYKFTWCGSPELIKSSVNVDMPV